MADWLIQRGRVELSDTDNTGTAVLSTSINGDQSFIRVAGNIGETVYAGGTTIGQYFDDRAVKTVFAGGTDIEFSRQASGANDANRITYEAWEGDFSSVAALKLYNLPQNTDSANFALDVTPNDISQCVPILASTYSDTAGNNDARNDRYICRLDLTGTNTLVIRRVNAGGVGRSANVYAQVIEFSAAYVVQHIAHSIGTSGNVERETITSAAPTASFVVATCAPTDINDVAAMGNLCFMSATNATQLKFWNGANAIASATFDAFIVTNPAAITTEHINSLEGGASQIGAAASPNSATVAITPVTDAALTGIIAYIGEDSTEANGGQNTWGYELSGTTSVEIIRSEGDASAEIALQVIQFTNAAPPAPSSTILPFIQQYS